MPPIPAGALDGFLRRARPEIVEPVVGGPPCDAKCSGLDRICLGRPAGVGATPDEMAGAAFQKKHLTCPSPLPAPRVERHTIRRIGPDLAAGAVEFDDAAGVLAGDERVAVGQAHD